MHKLEAKRCYLGGVYDFRGRAVKEKQDKEHNEEV